MLHCRMMSQSRNRDGVQRLLKDQEDKRLSSELSRRHAMCVCMRAHAYVCVHGTYTSPGSSHISLCPHSLKQLRSNVKQEDVKVKEGMTLFNMHFAALLQTSLKADSCDSGCLESMAIWFNQVHMRTYVCATC
jgi:hypothetical protein